MRKSTPSFNEHDMQRIVGNFLRWSVVIAILIVATGFFLYLFQQEKGTLNYAEFHPLRFQGFTALFKALFRAEYQAIIQLGILLLITTPVVRVIIALIGFFLEKDYLYVVISFIILSVIFLSIIFGYIA
jgi:uncharacterized membrane protein